MRDDESVLCSEGGRAELAHRLDVCAQLYAHQPVDYERCLAETCTLTSDFEDWRQRPGY